MNEPTFEKLIFNQGNEFKMYNSLIYGFVQRADRGTSLYGKGKGVDSNK